MKCGAVFSRFFYFPAQILPFLFFAFLFFFAHREPRKNETPIPRLLCMAFAFLASIRLMRGLSRITFASRSAFYVSQRLSIFFLLHFSFSETPFSFR